MAKFLPALQKVLSHEGGYVKDPNDPGGETYKGIARNKHEDWSGWPLIDQHKLQHGFPANLETDDGLQLLASKFYQLGFWDTINAYQITNQAIAESIFDFGVNTGVKRSAMLAQKVVGASVDGVIGIHSIEKINNFNPDHFLAAFALEKIAFYVAIIKTRPASKVYFYGWICRVLGDRA